MKKNYQNKAKKIAATALSGVLALNMAVIPTTTADAATEHWNDASAAWTSYKAVWEGISANYENVSLTPGVDETQLNLAWYSKTSEVPKVRIAKNEEMTGSVEFVGTQEDINATVEGYFSNKVIVKELEENTEYYYQVFKNGVWSDAKAYSTGSFKNYSILYVGDPQIGACKGQNAAEDGASMSENDINLAARNDSYNWNQVLTNATAQHDVSFMISAGDQVNTATKEEEYAGYLSAAPLASLPVATTIGNHDSGSAQYTYHYNNPNAFDKTDASNDAYTTGATKAGTDYYYTYGDVLFIMIDTNNYNCATHDNVIAKAVAENPDCKWRVVTFHQDIYGSGYDHSDTDGIVLRTQLTPIFDKYDIDVVLQGHDHTYSRTYQLTGDGMEHEAYSKTPSGVKAGQESDEKTAYLNQNDCYNIVSEDGDTVINPEGTVYFEANSATGSKFYNLIPVQQDYVAERSQTWTPSYSVIDVSESALTVTTFDATTGAVLAGSDTYTIVKESDKTALKEAIETAKETLKKKADYTDKTATALENAVVEAEKVVENKKATNKEVAEAAGAISKANAELTAKTAQTITVTTQIKKNENSEMFNLGAKNSGEGVLTYTSNNVKVATVDADGNVSINGAGKAIISVKAATTEKYAEAVKTVTIKVAPKAQNLKSLKATGSRKVKVSWTKNSKASGYLIKVATDKKFTKNVKSRDIKKATTYSATIKGLKKGKTYYAKVRAYVTIDGVKVYGAYSQAKKVKVK